jgi:short-subunit dehydrogenase
MKPQLKPLNEQVIVITGASSGIGLETALSAAKQGAKVVLAARSKNALDEIVSQITASGAQALAVECDVADRSAVDNLARTAAAHFGRIDTWVNDAGISIYGRLDECTDEDARRLFDTNYFGLVNGSLAALPYLKQNQNGGALINIGSEVSDAVAPLLGHYSASKHAVKGFTDTLRLEIEEVDDLPIAITLIQPTAVDTPFPQHARNMMEDEPKLPNPMLDPQKVADAILKAAVTPTRAARVGAMAVLNTIAYKVTPKIADKMSAKREKDLHSHQPPRNPEGALHRPSESSGTAAQTHGTGPK